MNRVFDVLYRPTCCPMSYSLLRRMRAALVYRLSSFICIDRQRPDARPKSERRRRVTLLLVLPHGVIKHIKEKSLKWAREKLSQNEDSMSSWVTEKLLLVYCDKCFCEKCTNILKETFCTDKLLELMRHLFSRRKHFLLLEE